MRAPSLIAAHSRSVLALSTAATSPPVVVSSSYDGSVKLWRVDDDDALHLFDTLLDGADGAVFSLATASNKDSLLLCTGSYSRRVRAWQISLAASFAPRQQWVSAQHTGWVRALALGMCSPSAKVPDRVYSIGCNRILGWSLEHSASDSSDDRTCDSETVLYEDAKCVRSHDILCLAHSAEDERLACGSVDGAVRVWSLSGAGVEEPLQKTACAHWIGHDDRVPAVAWCDNGVLITAGYDGLVRSWARSAAATTSATSTTSETGSLPAWEQLAQTRVANDDGRALCLAVIGAQDVAQCADAVSDGGARVLCGTSDGELVVLRAADLSVVERIGIGTEASDGAPARRVTTVVTLPCDDHGGEDGVVAVVGDSDGGLHVRRV